MNTSHLEELLETDSNYPLKNLSNSFANIEFCSQHAKNTAHHLRKLGLKVVKTGQELKSELSSLSKLLS